MCIRDSIHIQDPKINFKLFDFIIAPEHDEISGSNVISTKGAIHYLNKSEIVSNSEYLKSLIKTDKRKIFSLILGGPTKYYEYSKEILHWTQENNIQFINASSASVYGIGHKGFIEEVEHELPINMYAYVQIRRWKRRRCCMSSSENKICSPVAKVLYGTHGNRSYPPPIVLFYFRASNDITKINHGGCKQHLQVSSNTGRRKI